MKKIVSNNKKKLIKTILNKSKKSKTTFQKNRIAKNEMTNIKTCYVISKHDIQNNNSLHNIFSAFPSNIVTLVGKINA